MGSKSYSKGISWIDDCRIPFVDGGWGERKNGNDGLKTDEYGHKKINQIQNTQGRFPANILVSDDMLNDGSISSQNTGFRGTNGAFNGEGGWKQIKILTQGDKGTNSRYYDIDKWFDKILDV